jgi:hypothetical protein
VAQGEGPEFKPQYRQKKKKKKAELNDCMIAMAGVWATKPKIFTTWPFTEEVG